MARIRTIKPEFFRNYKLYKSEVEEKLPLRIAFAGLWTACDRDGRFKWVPETLKLDCLPFDNCDFSRVLDALWTRGYIVKYESQNEVFGYIPTWEEHQYINNRESESQLPNPHESNILTRYGRVVDASEVCTSGKERKGKERKGIRRDVEFINDNIKNAWLKWVEYKKTQFKFEYKTIDSEQEAINNLIDLCKGNFDDAEKIVKQSIIKGWKGLFEIQQQNTGRSKKLAL